MLELMVFVINWTSRMLAYTFNTKTPEAEASWRPAWSK